MKRFILRYRGKGPKPDEHVRRFRALPNTTVVDDSSPRMLLVEAPENELKKLVDGLPEWVMSEERMVPLPKPHPRILHGPEDM